MMKDIKVDQLHQTIVEAADKVQSIIKDHENPEEEALSFHERFSDNMFDFGSNASQAI